MTSFSFNSNQEASPREPGAAVWRLYQTKAHLYRDRVPFQWLLVDLPQGGTKAAPDCGPAARDV